MDLKGKVIEALRGALNADPIHLEDDDGLSGFAVSSLFVKVSPLDRQALIEKALDQAPLKLTKAEKRQILAIAGLSPVEYQALGLHANGTPGDGRNSRKPKGRNKDLKEKVTEALRQALQPVHIELYDDAGVYGFIVSNQFAQTSALDRQKLIAQALNEPTVKFTKAERRQIFLIAGLTPAEYAEHADNEH